METQKENKAVALDNVATKAAPAKAPAYRYTGDGHTFVFGVPARDLEAEDVASLTDEQKEHIEKSGVYSKGGK